MCDPIAVGIGVAAASTAANSAASSSASRSQNRYLTSQGQAQDENYRRTVESVREDIGIQTDALMAQQIEAISAQKQQLQNITRDARSASAAYTASLAETGVSGRSVDQVHQQFEREVLEFESAASRNISNYTAQLNREATAIYNRGQSIINQGYPAPLPPYQKVNYGLIAFQGALQGLQSGMAYHSATKTP
jgi:Spy/CpxP family protein refolding chaperone